MVGSLAVRILIEGWSVWRLSRIDLSDLSRRFVDSVASFRRSSGVLRSGLSWQRN